MMKKIMYLMCCLALGAAAVMAPSHAKAQASDQDKQFLTKASQANYDEIQLGKLAEQKATNASVKAFGRRMVTDHTRLTTQMKPFANTWGIAAPTSLDSDAQSEYDKLKGMSGADFDKEYINFMASEHAKDLNEFTDEANSTKDTKFKAAVEHGKTVISEHKTMADNLQQKVG
jgi:putative membrane protein